MGHHKIAIAENKFAIAAGNKLYSKDWSWGLNFASEILSVIHIERKNVDHLSENYGIFAVLLSNGQIQYVWSECCIKPLFTTNDYVGIESGCGGLIFGLRENGTVSVAFEENNPLLAKEVEGWHDIIQISTSSQHIIELKRNGTVVVAGENHYFEEIDKWKNIKKVYAFDAFPFIQSSNDQAFGIDAEGWLYVCGSPWNNARQYWRKLQRQYDVSDIVSNHDATLIRYTDGSCKLITPHALHNFENDMVFIQKYNNFRFLAARGDTVIIVDKDGEFRIDVNKEERQWWK